MLSSINCRQCENYLNWHTFLRKERRNYRLTLWFWNFKERAAHTLILFERNPLILFESSNGLLWSLSMDPIVEYVGSYRCRASEFILPGDCIHWIIIFCSRRQCVLVQEV